MLGGASATASGLAPDDFRSTYDPAALERRKQKKRLDLRIEAQREAEEAEEEEEAGRREAERRAAEVVAGGGGEEGGEGQAQGVEAADGEHGGEGGVLPGEWHEAGESFGAEDDALLDDMLNEVRAAGGTY